MVKLVIMIAMLAACQSHDGPAARGSGGSARDAKALDVIADAADEGSAVLKPPDEPEPTPDPGKTIADLGAVSAWQAVVDRGQYLSRRGQQGVVFGTLGAPIQMADPASDGGLIASPYTWLVDDTEGNGALAIRVMLGKHTAKEGDRVALAGSWVLDERNKYYWKVDELTALPAAPPSDLKDPLSQPGHAIINGNLPQGARTISLAKDNDAVYFMVTGKPPAIDGEGWPVANELGDPVFALLNLPGERPSFGGQDFRTPDERWQLKRGQTYWVRIGKIRRPLGPDKPATINARTAPVRVN